MAEGLVLRRMTQEEYVAYRSAAELEYAREIGRARGLDDAEAAVQSAKEYGELLPDGLDSPGEHLWTALVGDEPVGLGWFELRERPAGTSAWIFDVQVDEDRRGQGHGRALMEALHDAARDLGATTMALNVFGHNTTAIGLYDSLGYAVTAQQMRRDL